MRRHCRWRRAASVADAIGVPPSTLRYRRAEAWLTTTSVQRNALVDARDGGLAAGASD